MVLNFYSTNFCNPVPLKWVFLLKLVFASLHILLKTAGLTYTMFRYFYWELWKRQKRVRITGLISEKNLSLFLRGERKKELLRSNFCNLKNWKLCKKILAFELNPNSWRNYFEDSSLFECFSIINYYNGAVKWKLHLSKNVSQDIMHNRYLQAYNGNERVSMYDMV